MDCDENGASNKTKVSFTKAATIQLPSYRPLSDISSKSIMIARYIVNYLCEGVYLQTPNRKIKRDLLTLWFLVQF